MATNHHDQQSPAVKPSSNLVFIRYGVIVLLLLGGAYLLYKNTQANKAFAAERTSLRATVQQNKLANDR